MRKSLLWALLLSVLLHLGGLALPRFLPATASPQSAHFDAVLLPPPPVAAPAPTIARPAPKPVPAPHQTVTALADTATPSQPQPAMEPAAQPAPPVTPASPPPAPPSAEPATPAPRQLPANLKLVFDLIKGTQGLIVGQVTHRLKIDNGHYDFRIVAEATGLFSLIKPGQLTQHSSGIITPGGLQPEHFSTRRGSNAIPEEASFDWSQQQLSYGRQGETPTTVPLPPGSLDILSFFYQFALTAQPDKHFSFYMTNGRSFMRQEYAAEQIETIDTPMGPQQALLVKRTGGDGKEKVDIWLGLAQHYLPLRILFTDKNGDVAEQRLRILRANNNDTGAAAENASGTAATSQP